jgi:uncharacterized cupredoxin-like copper-binding protein
MIDMYKEEPPMRRNTTGMLALLALLLASLFFVACGSSAASTGDGGDDTAAAADDGHDDDEADHAEAGATVDDGNDDADVHEEEDLFAAEADETLVIDMQDIVFAPMEVTIVAGELVEIELINSGVLVHDFTIEEIHTVHAYHDPDQQAAGHDDHDAEYAMHHALEGGDSITMRMIAEEPGTYEFYCTVPGHREAGMIGTLIVQG